MKNGEIDFNRPGYERSATPEHIEKLTQLREMRKKFNGFQIKFESHTEESKRIRKFLKRYGDFMSADNYRAANPQPFNEEADRLIAEGERILRELGKK